MKASVKSELTLDALCSAAKAYAEKQTTLDDKKLYGVTDGKAVGTFLEGNFVEFLLGRFTFATGNAARGIDLPELEVDIKTTSIRQPQYHRLSLHLDRKSMALGTRCSYSYMKRRIEQKPRRHDLIFSMSSLSISREPRTIS